MPGSKNSAEVRAAAITELLTSAPDPGDHDSLRVWLRGACALGLHLLFVSPGSKIPADMRTPRQRRTDDKAARTAAREAGRRNCDRAKSEAGINLASNDPDVLLAYLDRYVEIHGADVAVNLAVRTGRSRLVVADADTPGQVAAYLTSAELPAGSAPTVTTPGQLSTDGKTMAHSDGGHWYFIVPDDVELPPESNGVTVGRSDDPDAYAILTGNRYVLAPPSVRLEGHYAAVGTVGVLPAHLAGIIITNGLQRRTKRERRAVRPAGAVSGADAAAAVLGETRPWDSILGAIPGWDNTGKPDGCGCDIWTAPGIHASPKSATAHEVDCARWDSDDPPLHIWTDHPGDPLEDLVDRHKRQTLTRLEVVAEIEYDGDMAEAIDDLTAPDDDDDDDDDDLDDMLAADDTAEPADTLPDTEPDTEPADDTDHDDRGPDLLESIPELAAAVSQGKFSDWLLAKRMVRRVLRGNYLFVRGLGWHRWDGMRWADCGDGPPTTAIGHYVGAQIRAAVTKLKANPLDTRAERALKAWKSAASASRLAALLKLSGYLVEIPADQLDANPDLLNTAAGVVHLPTGELRPHDPELRITKITGGTYRPGWSHPDVDALLSALPEAERRWLRNRIGQAITGHKTPDGVIPLLEGAGENGKTALMSGIVAAAGDYAYMLSPRLFASERGNDHSTERADLRGRRLVVGEELTEGRSLDVVAIKRITDVEQITARMLYKDNMTFPATHSMFILTNHAPQIAETDHGTWRRLARLRFRFTFRKKAADVVTGTDRLGDPMLKPRILGNESDQLDALLTWAVDGARAWYTDPAAALLSTAQIEADTRAWRSDCDRVLGFWTENLVADPDGKILATDMAAEFNRWLTGNGHREWAAETFGPRFAQHDVVTGNRIERRIVRNLSGLSHHPTNPYPTTPAKRAQTWLGVRFRSAADDLADPPLDPPAVGDIGPHDRFSAELG